MALQDLTEDISAMTDDVYRTRSQKRALEREGSNSDMESKKPKMECSPKGTEVEVDSDLEEVKKEVKIKTEPADRGGGRTSVLLKGSGEVKATIKVEVQAGDEPVDMSTSKSDVKKEKRPPSPDIIVLSDNEPSSPRMNGLTKVPGKDCNADIMMKSTPEERERMIKRLKEELRLEEAKLVLLKKLRQSQIQKEAIVPKPMSVSPQQIHNIRTHTSTAPPPLLLAPRASVPNAVQLQGQRIIPHGLIRVANVPNTSLLVNVPQASSTMKGSGGTSQSNAGGGGLTNSNDSPASRQAAAKLALRKQLEKTLLEIPPPKPPAPELTFLPSAANNEFIYLVGLEEVVQNLLETQGKSSAQVVPLEPNVCTQCKTDFTCRWRQEKTGTIMCEQCVTSNKKKALKAEHTNRLKAAFVKALQQEQEIEQRILQQTASPLQSKQESVQHHSMKQSSSQMSRGMQSTSSRAVLHTFSQSSQLQNSVSGLGGRPAKHTERASKGGNTNWRKQIASPAGRWVTMAYVSPSLSVHKSSSAVDRQREYLLDMIPSRSISQSASTWK
ncbi:GATA zinc finger domain containing 2Ab isoform X6 [Callorhinchus milii]|uniref:GATA zinc finger domain containing 2Ab isoform X6 n=1 Tax=Callorhinchus milii TaxID=7868 RepID=UPI001C3F9F10|nr:GATA zinc finger domain containing 2Ab isoform X6 [Callorhinchus milii]